ncbi:hypothetical protein EAF04_005668 [Stromatinia cepivora]|nr:hypothetical protein EAF04_005668 [Stromatinia cepivora]
MLISAAKHTPANYKSYTNALKAQDFNALCPQLPSWNDSSPPSSLQKASPLSSMPTNLSSKLTNVF